MNNDRAIELLHRISDSQFDGIHGDERREALEMAVRALEGDGDTISRKMAIDAMRKLPKWNIMREDYKNVGFSYDDVMFTLEKLTSAQPERPEQPESAKEYCAECNHIEMCRWYPYEGCEFRSLPSAQPQWIPFTEMMPAFGESVLVQFDDDDMDILTFPNIYKRLKRVAWMPLPKPYGGESDV